MNFKKLLGGGLLATVLALGVGAGLAVHSESKEADADVVLSNFIMLVVIMAGLILAKMI